MQVGMDVIDSAGERFPPDSSSNSADPLKMEIIQLTRNHTANPSSDDQHVLIIRVMVVAEYTLNKR